MVPRALLEVMDDLVGGDTRQRAAEYRRIRWIRQPCGNGVRKDREIWGHAAVLESRQTERFRTLIEDSGLNGETDFPRPNRSVRRPLEAQIAVADQLCEFFLEDALDGRFQASLINDDDSLLRRGEPYSQRRRYHNRHQEQSHRNRLIIQL